MSIILYSLVITTIRNVFSGKVFFVIDTFFSFAIAYHHPTSNAPQDIKTKPIRCDILDRIFLCNSKSGSLPLERIPCGIFPTQIISWQKMKKSRRPLFLKVIWMNAFTQLKTTIVGR